MTFKNNRAPLLSNIKLYASFHHHMWIQTGVTVRKRLNGVMTSVTLTFDLWPWPFAWTSLLSLVITPENFMIIQWQEHCQKGVTDGQMDRRTDKTEIAVLRADWSQLKTKRYMCWFHGIYWKSYNYIHNFTVFHYHNECCTESSVRGTREELPESCPAGVWQHLNWILHGLRWCAL